MCIMLNNVMLRYQSIDIVVITKMFKDCLPSGHVLTTFKIMYGSLSEEKKRMFTMEFRLKRLRLQKKNQILILSTLEFAMSPKIP